MLELIKTSKKRPQFPKNGLLLYLDAADQRSYNGSNIWNDLSGLGNHVELFGNITKVDNLLKGDGQGSYGRTVQTLDLTSTKDVTVIFVMKSNPGAISVAYEHTANWNQANDYDGRLYGGFGLAVNSSGSTYVEHQMHFQFRGNSSYAGINIDNPTSYNETMYAVIHDAGATQYPQSSAFVNGVEKPHDQGNPYIAINSHQLGNDFFHLWGRADFGTSSVAFGLMLVYDRKLSVIEINEIKSMIQDRFDF